MARSFTVLLCKHCAFRRINVGDDPVRCPHCGKDADWLRSPPIHPPCILSRSDEVFLESLFIDPEIDVIEPVS